jgi:hypothetical protein
MITNARKAKSDKESAVAQEIYQRVFENLNE